jgi:DNA-directed RNA polymerase specialized sigma24 family protein
MGGAKGSFETTRWTQIQKAKTYHQQRRKASVNNLLNRYWKPVYCYLMHKGYGNEDAKDLTQGFFCEIVLGRELIQQADRAKGRFRTFLLTALDRYVTSVYRKETARKRLPEHGLVRLEVGELPDLPIAESKATPELAFNYTWATSLLDQVLGMIKIEYCSTGRDAYWGLFHATVVAPILDNTEAPALTELCRKYGIESEKKASNMTITVKRRFSTALKRHLRQFVQSDSEVEDELRTLIQILSKGGAV